MKTTALVLAILLPATALAQANSFDLVANGKIIGHSTFTLAKAKQGFRLTGKVGYSNRGADAHLSDDVRLSGDYAFQQGSLTDDNTQTVYSFTPDKSRTVLTIGTVQAGQMDQHKLAIKPDLAFLPGFDAGAAQVMLLLATSHPSATNLYSILIPGVGSAPGSRGGEPQPSGEAPAAAPRSGNFDYDALWAKGPDATGSLDGKPVALHTFTLAGGKATWTFYADDQNSLMELDASMVGASCIRVKFKLDAAK